MCSPIQFFKDIKTDILVAFDREIEEPKDIQNQRIVSIAFRILGTAIALYTTLSFLSKISLIAGSPLAALALLISTAIGIILAHDLIRMGCNLHTKIALFNPLPAGLLSAAGNLLNDAQQIGQALVKEATSGTPSVLHDTWVFEPVYQQFETCANEEKKEERS